MPIAIASTSTPTSNTTSDPLDIAYPSGLQTDELVLHIAGCGNANAGTQPNVPTGFTRIAAGGAAGTADVDVVAHLRLVDGTEGANITHSNTGTITDNFCMAARITGSAISATPHVTGTVAESSTDSTTIDLPSITTTVNGCRIFYVVALDGGNGLAFAGPGGWTNETGVTTGENPTAEVCGGWGWIDQGTAGATGDITITSQQSNGLTGFLFALEPGESSGGGGAASLIGSNLITSGTGR